MYELLHFYYQQYEVIVMNHEIIKGNWNLIKGKIKEQWGNLTDDDLDKIAGKREQLIGLIQKQYGLTKEDVEKQLKAWEDRQ